MGRQMTKMNIIFSMGNGIPNTVLKFFPRKSPCWPNESQKIGFGGHFPPYGSSIGPTNKIHPCVDQILFNYSKIIYLPK